MINTQNRKRKRTTDLPVPTSSSVAPGLHRNLNEFLQSLGDVLIDTTAVEVNTMVVEQITGEKFVAWEAYREIYPISEEYLEQRGIHESLRDRYLKLRQTLEVEYRSLQSDPTSEFYDPTVLEAATDPIGELHDTPTRLPDPTNSSFPEEILKAQRVLKNCRFLRNLRKVSELKAALDHRNQALHRKQAEQSSDVQPDILQKAVTTDMIYAQTVIQLDGDVINRYSQDILDHPHRDVILQIHREGVSAGEQQWRGLLEFVIGLLQASLQWTSGRDVSSWNSSQPKGQR